MLDSTYQTLVAVAASSTAGTGPSSSSADAAPSPTQPATGCVGMVGAGMLIAPPAASGLVETVGAGKEFSTIAAAVTAATDGTTILVDAGTYTNDFAIIRNDVTMVGVGGMVNMVATEPPPDLKGILTVDDSATIENFSFSGCAIDDDDGGNGAGIRYEGGDMVLKDDVFTGNQDGILAFPVDGYASNTIVLDHDTFDGNGSGSGLTHNAYVGAVDSLTATNNEFESAVVGHELKSRALVNTITNNDFNDGQSDPSYDIDLPNGGKDLVAGNTIEKGPNAENDAMVHFGGEGIPYAGSSLTVTGNTFVDDKGGAVGVLNQTAVSAVVDGDTFENMAPSSLAQGPASLSDNWNGAGAEFADGALVGVLPGATDFITDSADHAVDLDGSNGWYAVQDTGTGHLTTSVTIGHVVVISGAGGMDYTEYAPSGGNSITTAAGATDTITLAGQDLVDSEGDDTINVGTGNLTAVVNGSAVVNDAAETDQTSIDGTAVFHAHDSDEFLSVGAAGNVSVDGTVAYLEIDSNGGAASYDVATLGENDGSGAVVEGVRQAATFSGGSFQMRQYDNRQNITTAGGPQGVTMTLAHGDADVTSVGSDVIHAGDGVDNVIVEGAATVYAGSGQLNVFGRADFAGAKIYGAAGDVVLDGDTGRLTYFGSASANSVESDLSNDSFVGGAGRMTVNGGSGENIQGGSGGLTFNEGQGGGNYISTVAGAADMLDLNGDDTIDLNGDDTVSVLGGGPLYGVLGGHATLATGAGDTRVTLTGDDVVTGTGYSQINVAVSADAVVTESGDADVYDSGGVVHYSDDADPDNMDSVEVTKGQASISSDGAGGVTVNVDPGSDAMVGLTAGSDSVQVQSRSEITAGPGADYIQFNAGSDGSVVRGGAGSATIRNDDWSGASTVTIDGGSGRIDYDQGPGRLVFVGGSGAANINGEYGSIDVTGGSGDLTVQGGDKGMTFRAGSGAADVSTTPHGSSVTFGAGATNVTESSWEASPTVYSFDASQAGGTDSVSGFELGLDQLRLGDLTVDSVGCSAGSTTLSLSDGTTLLLKGVADVSSLNLPMTPTAPATTPLVLDLSEDAYRGDAQFTVSIDGVEQGPARSVTALHAQGRNDAFTYDVAPGAHEVSVAFLNDLYAGTPQTDRNLYIDGATYGGAAVSGSMHAQYSDGAFAFGVTPPPPAPAQGQDQLVVNLSEDAYRGDARFSVSIDGVQQGSARSVTALHSQGQNEAFAYDVAPGPHDVRVSFLNDLYAGSAQADRNLYVNSVTDDGSLIPNSAAPLYSNASMDVKVGAPTAAALPAPTASRGDDTLVLNLSEDAYLGDAQFIAYVDGRAIGPARQVDALHAAGDAEPFTFNGSFGAGPHTVEVDFINDAWGGAPGLDRNLYVDSLSLDGQSYADDQAALYSAGGVRFTLGSPVHAADTAMYVPLHG